jgi:hypothetical protein
MPAPTLVQAAVSELASVTGTVGVAFNLSFGSNTTAGNLITYTMLGIVTSGTQSLTPVMITSGYTQASTAYNPGSPLVIASCFYKPNAASIPSGTNQEGIISWSGGSNTITYFFSMAEWSGVIAASPFDAASAGATGTSGTPTCGSISPVNSGDLIIGAICSIYNGGAFILPGTGYTQTDHQFGTNMQGSNEYLGGAASGAQRWVSQAWAFTPAVPPSSGNLYRMPVFFMGSKSG